MVLRIDERVLRVNLILSLGSRQFSQQVYTAAFAAQLAHEDAVQARAALLPTANGFSQFIYTQPNGTPKSITVDTTVTAATIDDNALSVFLPALPLEPGKTFNLSVFSSGDGVTKTVSVKVGAIENVAVPAGTFPAYRLELSGMQLPIVMHVTQQAPRRVVRVAPTGAPLIFELVK